MAEAAQVHHTIREYLKELKEQNPVEEPVNEQDQVSTTGKMIPFADILNGRVAAPTGIDAFEVTVQKYYALARDRENKSSRECPEARVHGIVEQRVSFLRYSTRNGSGCASMTESTI